MKFKKITLFDAYIAYSLVLIIVLVVLIFNSDKKESKSIIEVVGKSAREIKKEFDKGYNDTIKP